MTDMEKYILKRKGMRELYDVICEYPDGVRVSQIRQRFPTLSAPALTSMLGRMYDAGMVSKTRSGNGLGCVWRGL